ncbi:MAG: transcriptional repressor [Pseudomonadota bacterium]
MRQAHAHKQCITNALERADRICLQNGKRLTPTRKRVLELIWQSHKPIKAYDLLAQLSTGDHLEKPPTVYRALDFLLDNNLIHKIESTNSYIGCEYEHTENDSKFFICDICNEVKELDEPKLNKTLEEASSKQGFKPNQTKVEIHGTCAKCSD